ncbi:hypothetical protein KEM54_002128 [Ascosphaera aggregata]|nr:hypothetical protein KEM54_002128 [Ascosphaera aggregata]
MPTPSTPSHSSRAASSLGFRTGSRMTNRMSHSSPSSKLEKAGNSPPGPRRRTSNGFLGQTARGGGVLDPPPYSKLHKPSPGVSSGSTNTVKGAMKFTRPVQKVSALQSQERSIGSQQSESGLHHDEDLAHTMRNTQRRPETSLGHSSRYLDGGTKTGPRE